MKKVKFICMLALLITIAYSQVMLKAPGDARLSPRLLNYQGYLTAASGIPITDPSVSMTFTIYDALSSGNQKWTETQPSVSIDKGVFSVILGSVTPIPDTVFTAGSDRWLELTVEAQTLSPRTRIVSSAYAYTSTYSDTADYARNAVADNDWSFLISDGADTTLQMGGRWGIARAGNTMYGNADSTHTNFGVACTTGTSGQNRKYCTVGGGFTNKASSGYTTVGGGVGNVASGYWATVGGGNTNSASGQYTTVGGGYQNSASGNHSTVGGGYGNYAVGSQSIVGGGYNNGASKQYAAVGGGWYNFANGYVATISGGEENAASNDYATVGGGRQNTASGDRTTIGGGANNTAGGYSSVIGGGRNNSVNDSASIIGGGYQNQIAGQYSAILGGYANTITATGDYSYLFGINSNLTQDSTFMVDLPHIRFGTEATGYEFPVTDGSNGQALVTDGSGQVSWVSTVDTDWSFLVSDGADTTLQMGGRWGLARYGNTLYGNADSTHVNLGVGSTTGSSGQDYKYITVGGGYGNIATYNWTTIGGGDRNTAGLSYATVGGGVQNNAGGQCATVGGGSTNIATSECATVAGGNVNTAGNYNATVSGGQGNIASGYIATVGGGKVNRARGDYSVVNGGGGPSEADSNSAIGNYSAIGGGRSNIASVEGATVGGGLRNTASGIRATVGGGLDNIASGLRATVGGGYLNTASFQQATVGGGYNNIASGVNATVGGGENNITNQLCATVGGGYYNYAAGAYSAILGGYANTITATGDYSYLFGINSNLTQDSTFMVDLPHIRFGTEAAGYEFPVTDGSNGQVLVTDGSGKVSWGSPADADWTISSSDMYSTVSGNVGIGTATPNEKLHVAGNIEASGFNVTGTKYYLESSGFRSTASPADWYMSEDANDLIFITADAKEYVRIKNQTGLVGIGTTTPTAKLDVSGSTGYDQIRMRTTYTPSSSSDPNGNVGDVAWDDSYVYIKTSAGWKRSALTTW